MKSYRKSFLLSLCSSIFLTLNSGLQLYINFYYGRIVFIYFFSIVTLGLLYYTLLQAFDVITKETKEMKVTVMETNKNIIKVLKPNGKKRGIRIPNHEINKYQINDELQLTLAKRTDHILELNVQDNSKSDNHT